MLYEVITKDILAGKLKIKEFQQMICEPGIQRIPSRHEEMRMTNSESQKVMMTVSVDRSTRNLMHKYGGLRGVGKLLAELIRKHDVEA